MKKVLIIGAIIILAIIFIVKMSETPDGIGTVQETQEKYNKTLQEKEKVDKQYQDTLENLIKSKENLERLEKGY